MSRRIQAWIAHASHADTWRLRRAIFEGGSFRPRPGGLNGPLPPCSAAAGSWNNKPRNLRLGQPQQEQDRQPEQQQRVPDCQHASLPEPTGSRFRPGAREEAFRAVHDETAGRKLWVGADGGLSWLGHERQAPFVHQPVSIEVKCEARAWGANPPSPGLVCRPTAVSRCSTRRSREVGAR